MAKYSFSIEAVISMHTEVEADNLSAAIVKAQSRATQSLCYHCAHGEEGSWNTSGELDCEPASCALVDASEDDADVTEKAKDGW